MVAKARMHPFLAQVANTELVTDAKKSRRAYKTYLYRSEILPAVLDSAEMHYSKIKSRIKDLLNDVELIR